MTRTGGPAGRVWPRRAAALAAVLGLALVLPAAAATMVNQARVGRARRQAAVIAQGIRAFARDVGHPPIWLRAPGSGGPAAVRVDVLVGSGQPARSGSAAADPWTGGRADALANQLVSNAPGYPRPERTGERGWSGPYLQAAAEPDPWNNRYVVNIGQVADSAAGSPRGVWALSAGPNGVFETPFDQPGDGWRLGGDDVGARIW